MVHKRLSLTLIYIFFSATAFGQQQLLILNSDGTQSSYTGVFTDEFNASKLDESKWMNAFPWGRHLTGNSPEEESQEYYTDGRNMILSAGKLLLTAKREKTCGICESWMDSTSLNKNGLFNYRCFDYSSAMIYSKEEYGVGFYEIRFKQSLNSNGLWPAFWLFGNADEIDVFENKGERPSATHWDVHCKNGCNRNYGGWHKVKTDFTSDFNTISLDWYPDGQRWFCNGENYATTTQKFEGKMHLIVNNAVSRTRKEKGFWVGPDTTTVFPAELEMDYIRYYKKNYEGKKWKSRLKNDEVVDQLRTKSATYKNRPVKSHNDQLMTLYIDQAWHQITVNYVGNLRRKAIVTIYNSSGKLLKELTAYKKRQIIIDQLPDESLIVVARVGRKMLAERVEGRR